MPPYCTAVACIAGGIRERVSGSGAAIFSHGRSPREACTLTALLPKQKHSRAKSRQLRRLTLRPFRCDWPLGISSPKSVDRESMGESCELDMILEGPKCFDLTPPPFTSFVQFWPSLVSAHVPMMSLEPLSKRVALHDRRANPSIAEERKVLIQYPSIFLLIYIVYFNCNMLGTNKVVVVVVVVISYITFHIRKMLISTLPPPPPICI